MFRSRKDRLANWLYERLGPDDGGLPSPPGDNLSAPISEHRTAYTADDGFWLRVQYNGEHDDYTSFHMREVRALMRFIIVDWWVKATWCGVRRALWYWALSQRVARYRR